jgi:eukaryotic-like serine/threonine-protein kinase
MILPFKEEFIFEPMIKFLFSKAFLIQLGIAMLVAIVGIFLLHQYLEHYTRSGEAIEVVDLTGYDIIEAEAILKEAGLAATIVDSLFIQGKHGGEIVDQVPRPTSLVKSGRKIFLTITRYKTPSTKLPNVINQGLPLAQAKLTSYGFRIGKLIPRPDPCIGCAIGFEVQGKKVEVGKNLPKGTFIDLIFGKMADGATVPAPLLSGLSLDEAKMMLNLHQLNIGAIINEADNKDDSIAAKVYWQSQPMGSPVSMGESINIRLTPDVTKLPEVNIDSLKALLR